MSRFKKTTHTPTHTLVVLVVAATKTVRGKPCDTPHACFDQHPETQ